jgi:cbb3-type cytochrome oxidase subunit 3
MIFVFVFVALGLFFFWLIFAMYRRGRRHERMRWEADWKRETAERRNSQL